MPKAVVCIAEADAEVDAIVKALELSGFSSNNISVIEVHDLFPEMEIKPRWRKSLNGRGLVRDKSHKTAVQSITRDSLDLKKTG